MSPLRRIYNYTTRKYEFVPVASSTLAAAAAINLEITENTISYKRTGSSSSRSIENIQKDLLNAVLLLEKLKTQPPKK